MPLKERMMMVMMMVVVVVMGEYGVCDDEGRDHGDGVAVKPGTVMTVVMTAVMVASLPLEE